MSTRRKTIKTSSSTPQEKPAVSVTTQPELIKQTANRAPGGGSRRVWVGRIGLMFLVPAFLLGLLEGVLRLAGYGYPTSFFVKMEDGVNYTANRCFGWQFFPRETATSPHPFLMPVKKEAGTLRIFVLGESAALGTPAPPFGFSRILEVMLRAQFPNRRFEMINAAMRGIDSNIVLPIAKECARHEPDLFLVYMGNNEAIGLYCPEVDSLNLGSRRWLLRLGQRAKATKVYQLLESVFRKVRKASEKKPQDSEFFHKHRFAADASGREITYKNFRANLGAICRLSQRSGTKMLVSTVGANLKDFPPLASLHRTGLTPSESARWESAFAAGIAAETAAQYPVAISNYVEATRLDDHYAELHFRMARSYLASGQYAQAQQHYQLSSDWDALQFRTDSRLNAIMREIAGTKEGEGIRLVDGERAFAQSALSDQGIPGSSLFNDHVHMSFDGDYLLAQTFFPFVVSALGLTNHSEGAIQQLPSRAECAERLGFSSWEEASVAVGMLRSLDKPPFLEQLEHRERQGRAEQALRARVREASTREQIDHASAIYRAAIAAQPGDWQLHYAFANFLAEIQDFPAAVEEFTVVTRFFPKLQPVRVGLAKALFNTGKTREALDQLSDVLSWDPDYAPAKALMAQIHARSSPFGNRR